MQFDKQYDTTCPHCDILPFLNSRFTNSNVNCSRVDPVYCHYVTKVKVKVNNN